MVGTMQEKLYLWYISQKSLRYIILGVTDFGYLALLLYIKQMNLFCNNWAIIVTYLTVIS